MAILSCPLPRPETERILLAHGGGGRLTLQLIENVFLRAFSNSALNARTMARCFRQRSASCHDDDTYVVNPVIFPGGTIGNLAVNGTVNDLAMCGARAFALSAGFILEEVYRWKPAHSGVLNAGGGASRNVPIVTGDTKVVDKGKGDGIFVNTTGIGMVVAPRPVGPELVRPGDVVLVSGELGTWHCDSFGARRPRIRRPCAE